MSGSVGHELLEVPDTPDRLPMQSAGCFRWAVGGKRSGSVRLQERRENRNSGVEQEETKRRNTYLLSSVPDSPDRLDLENGDSLSRAVGGKRPRPVYKERRENGISNSREQMRAKRGMATSVTSSDCPIFSGVTSCRRQLRLSKMCAFSQDQDHEDIGSPLMETCKSAEDKNLPKNDELCHTTQEEVKGNMKESICGHAILTPKWNRTKMLVRNGRISPDDVTSNANMSNRGVKKLQVASDNLKGGMTSRARQLRLSKKGSFSQDQDHEYQGSPPMETCNEMSAEDRNLSKNDELCHTSQEEVKGDMQESISGHAILRPKWNQRKMLVRNGRIAPDDATSNTNKGVKRLQVAGDNLKGSVTNDVSADASRSINGKHLLQPSGSYLPCSAQLDDRRKGKEIVSGDMNERGQESSVQLTQRRKRMRGDLSSYEEAVRLPRCLNTTTYRCHGSSSMATEARSQEPRNGILLNRSPDNEYEENIQLACGTRLHSRIHQNEGQSSRLDKTSSRSSPLPLVVDEENSSDTGTPEVIFLRSSRQLRKNIPSTSITCNAQASSSDAVDPIDVDSLQSPDNNIVNIDASNKVSEARLRQIEQDEMLARQLQEELAGEILEERLQRYDPVLHTTVQRERTEHMSPSDSGSLFPGLRASFAIGARREPARSLRNHAFSVFQSARASPLSNLRSAHSRTITVNGRVSGSGLMGRSRGRSVHDRAFRFPRNVNIEMRVDLLEAMEQIAETHNLAHQLISGVQRDFNEDDYEMLLALDDNNDNHRGASEQHIERLPTSIIQNDVSDEECSICLENPKVGDVIRHLLCMHKFHKECIDPWLAIQSCCPVCKHFI